MAADTRRANEAQCELLAEALGVRTNALEIAHGAKGRNKLVRVRGLTVEAAEARMARAARKHS